MSLSPYAIQVAKLFWAIGLKKDRCARSGTAIPKQRLLCSGC